jgi:hypothetical protein
MSIEMLSIGVVTMFVTAGILIHSVYLIKYDNFIAVPAFWSSVIITSITMLWMKFSEDRKERRKEGVYDVSWQDDNTMSSGPYAKIDKAAEELSSSTAAALGSLERVESFGRRERIERDLCTQSKILHKQVQSLRKESDSRAKIRKEVFKLLTTATEELDALPEELIAHTNKILHSTDEADVCTANLVSKHEESDESLENEKHPFTSSRRMSSSLFYDLKSTSMRKMGIHPIDAQRLPVSIVSLRKKLGEISHTTLLRLRNTSSEPLRLKSGVQLKDGKYVKSINASDPRGSPQTFHLYPGTEIPPRTEVLVAARSRGGFLPTSGIAGKIVYTNYDESWTFEVHFRNDLIGNVRRSSVKAYPKSGTDDNSIATSERNEQSWQISKDEYDAKANNEIAISFDALHGESTKPSFLSRQSTLTLKSGLVFKKGRFGLGLHWQRLWCELTPVEITFFQDPSSEKREKISLQYVTKLTKNSDRTTENVFEIYTSLGLHCISTKSPKERDDWIKSISDAVELINNSPSERRAVDSKDSTPVNSVGSWSIDSPQSYIEDGVECIQRDRETEILSV